jgi:hypothetical protein
MADGFVLNVDAKFLQDLEKADKKMSDLVDKSNSLSKSVVESFNKISTQGVDPFLEKLKQQKNALEAIASVDVSKASSKGLKDLVKSASNAVDQINKIINALQGSGTSMDVKNATKKVESEIKKETDVYLKELDKQIKARQEYLSRQEQVEQERVKITQNATKKVESEIKKETDAYLKSLEIKIKAAQEQQLRNEQIRSQRESISNKAKEQVEREIKSENDAYLRGLSERIKQEQEYQLRNEKVKEERKRIEAEATKFVEKEIQKEKDAHLKSLSDQIKARQEYLERVRKLQEAQAKKESDFRIKQLQRIQKYGDTSKQAEAAYNRLYGEHGIKSVNNMNRALQRLQDAQNKLNLNTDKGRQKYDELGKKIQQIKRDLDKATQANEKFHNSHSKLLNTTDQLQRKLALLFSISAIQGYMDKLVNVRKEFELQQKSLQVLLRDKDQADKLWQQTIDLAVKSPFRVSQLVSYTKQLAAYRIESDKLYDTTKMLSDVSAGLGVDMQRIILAFGQVRAANFLRGTELRQFTEAGIPMLDELAEMFTELEGRAVSAGDVFERISKRMVVFRDVEEVFKRMTSESGVFYNMQEEQSKTLFGMISNLHDSIDLMLNDIGRSNDGIIKDMVSLTRDLVENWRGVATVLKQVGVTIAMIGLTKFATGWKIASTAITTGSASSALAMNGMAGSAARLRIAMSTLGKTISANPWFLLVGALSSAGHALWEYVESINAANSKYDDMSRREIARIDQLEELQKKTEQYNAIIEDGNASEQERNKAQLENDKILRQIKAKYPELYPLIVQQENKTIDLTKAIERQNEVLEVNIALQQRAKGGFFQEDFSENYKDALKSQDALKSSLVSLQSEASQASAKLKMLSTNGDIPKNVADNFDNILKSIRKSKTFDEAKKYIYEFNDAFQKIGSDTNLRIPLFDVFNDVRNKFAELNNEQINYTNSLSIWGANLDKQMDAFRVGIEDAMVGLNADEANKKATQWVNQQLDALGVVDKELKKWAQQYIVKETGVKLTFVEEGKKVYTESDLTKEWQKKIWNAIKKVESTNPDIRLGVTLEDVATQDLATLAKTLNESVENAIKENKNVIDVGKITEQVRFTPQQIKNAEDSVEPLQMLADVIGLIIKQTSDNKGKDWMSEVVKGIKEAHQEYIKLNKTLGESESKQMALDKYAKSFAESARNAGLKDISLGQFKFETEEGAIEALEFLKNKLPQSAKQARFKLEEAIGEIRGEVRIRTKAEDDKLLIEQIEDMFSGYEMSIELQKLNIPKDLAKQLFNIDALTLPDLREKVKSMETKFVGTDMEEEYRKFLKKIDEMEDKANLERLKKFSKFLVKTTDEIANVQKQGALDITYAQNLFLGGKIDAEKYSEIIKNVVNEVNKDISKINLEKFKESPEYIAAMGDMAGYTISELSKLSDKIRDLISDNAKTMTPDEIEAYNDALNKINEQVNKIKSPFGKSWLSELREINALEKELTREKEKQLRLQKELQNKQFSLDALNQKLEELRKLPQSTGRDIQIQGVLNDITNVQKGMSDINGQLNTTSGNISSIGGKLGKVLGGMGTSIAIVDKIVKGISQSIDATITVFNDFKDLMDSFGVDTDTAAWQDITLAMETLGEVNQKATQGWEDLKNGNVAGAVANTLGAVMSVIKGINKIHDAKYERRIQREAEFVESLQHAYEKLGKAIDDAYSIDTLKQSGKNAKDNLQNQIQSYNKMIAAEEDKKNTDDDRIKEWQYQIEDLEQQIEDLNKDLVSTATGGIMDDVLSAAQEFTNAWLEAFNETGDGLSGLEDNFKETMLEMVKQQAAMLISNSYIEKWKKQLEQYINPDDLELSTDEAKKWVDAVTTSLPQLNQALENYFTAMQQAGVDLGGGQGELSGLQRGIQGVTEETAQIIEAYLNSIRFFVAEQNTYLSQIAASFGNAEVENPMVEQLRIIAAQTSAINSLLQGLVRGGHSLGGSGLKVFIS